MPNASVAIDHVHLLSKDPQATASWYADKLGGKLLRSYEVRGALHVYVSFGDAMVIVRSQRPAELPAENPGLHWGMDHFGISVKGDFDGYCAALRGKGIVFTMEPTDINPTTRIAFIQAPDGVSIELLCRKAQT